MSRILFLGFRSTVFYTVYVASLLIHSSLCLAAGPFLSIQSRYRFFTLWNRFVMLWLRIACGIRFQVTGIDNIPPAPYVVLSNHQSPWETIYFYILFQPVCAILKKELLSIPFFGWGMRLLQPIAIDRSKKRFARNQILAQGRERIKDGLSILVFPESTRVPPGQTKAFSNGGTELAIRNGVPILPVAHNAGVHWPGKKFLKYPGTVQVVIGKPIATAGKEEEIRQITRDVETWIRQAIK